MSGQPPAPPGDDPFAFLKEPPAGGSTIPSRAAGAIALAGGAAMLAWAFSGDLMPRKVFMALVSFGPALIWLGLGLVAVPLRGEQFEKFQNERDFGQWFRAMPVFWKVWSVLLIVVTIAGVVTAIVLVSP